MKCDQPTVLHIVRELSKQKYLLQRIASLIKVATIVTSWNQSKVDRLRFKGSDTIFLEVFSKNFFREQLIRKFHVELVIRNHWFGFRVIGRENDQLKRFVSANCTLIRELARNAKEP